MWGNWLVVTTKLSFLDSTMSCWPYFLLRYALSMDGLLNRPRGTKGSGGPWARVSEVTSLVGKSHITQSKEVIVFFWPLILMRTLQSFILQHTKATLRIRTAGQFCFNKTEPAPQDFLVSCDVLYSVLQTVAPELRLKMKHLTGWK